MVTASQDHLSQSLRNTYWGDFDPRISIAFRPFRDNKTVFRAGFGIFTQTPLGQLAYDFIGIPLGAPYTYSNNNGGAPLFTFPQTSPTNQALQYGGTGFYDGMSPNFKDPQTAQWNVTIERQLTSALAVRITYSGMNSYRMNVKEDYNAIPPSKQPYVPSPYVDPRAPYQNWDEINYSANAGFCQLPGAHRWKLPTGCRTDCTSRRTTPGPITSATLKATLRTALPRKTSCLRPPTINSTCERLAEMWRACPGNGSC